MSFARRSLIALTAVLPLLFACAHPPSETAGTRADTVYVLRHDDDVHAISAAYHERLRLGLGSPFRLIEIAARDTRFTAHDREELLRDLFERVESGDIYQAVQTLPHAHLRVIEHALTSAHDPRVAELAINLAYDMAADEHAVTPELQYAAAVTAAMLRDRALAQRDAAHVRNVARTHGLAPHALVPALRAQRVLSVEQPVLMALQEDARSAANRLALLLVGGVRQATRLRGVNAAQTSATELTRDVAERILALQREDLSGPPQSALIIAMRATQLTVFNAEDEETFVAQLALAGDAGKAKLAAQRAAIALRPLAQERVWNARMQAPSAADLLVMYGVRVTFTDDVPARWRPYYRAQLDEALADLRLVLPALNLQGLTIEVGDVDAAAQHLAYHDPRARLIRWAPATGSGSLAHEIGHDLDWQIGRRAYRRKAGYASDYASDVAAMMALTRPGERGSERPRELLARQFDWLVAAGLAAQGRMNGVLSAAQNHRLRGHGASLPPSGNAQSANALAGTIGRAVRLDEAALADLASTLLRSVPAPATAMTGPTTLESFLGKDTATVPKSLFHYQLQY